MIRSLKSPKTKKIIAQFLRDGHRMDLAIQGDSMTPAIRDGDILTIEGCGYGEIAVGDVVVYDQGPFIAHRVLRKETVAGRSFVATRGDAASSGEERVEEERILGKVIHIARPSFLKRLRFFLGRKRSLRLAAAKKMAQAARFLNFFSAGLLPVQDLIEYNRRYFMNPNRLQFLAKECQEELLPQETTLLDRFASKKGNLLVLGCGSGREALALAGRGFKVTGVDYATPLLDLARDFALNAGVGIDWVAADITAEWRLKGNSFDLITLFGQLYSHIPGRPARVALLKRCRQSLKADGICILNFLSKPEPSPMERRLHWWRRRFAWVVRGNSDCQLGDHWHMGEPYYHCFSSIEEIAGEAAEAGFSLISGGEEGFETMAVLKTPSPLVGEGGVRG